MLAADLLSAAVARPRPAGRWSLLDLALPRDVDPAAHDVPGVTVVDLETLADVLATTEHAADVEATREIVAEEVAAFLGWQRAASVAPTVVALRAMADDVVQAELVRLDRPAARPRRRGPAPRSSRPCAGSSTSCCTRRPCG